MVRKKRTIKKRSKGKTKPIGITRIPKGNKRKLKSGVAFVYGSLKKPRFGTKRFKSTKTANKYAREKGLI